MKRKLVAASIASVLLLPLASCTDDAPPLEKARKDRVALIAAVPFAAPYFYQAAEDLVGPEAELANRIMEQARAGEEIRTTFAARTSRGLVESVAGGDALFGISAVGITGERRQQVDFSDSYHALRLSLIVNPAHKRFDGSPTGALAGLKVGVRQGSAVEAFVLENLEGSVVVAQNTLDTAVLALRRREIDAIIDDRLMAAYSLASVTGAGGLELMPEVLGEIEIAIAVPKNAPELLAIVNDVVSQAKSQGLYRKWLAEHLGQRLAQVEKRYTDRKEREQKAREPRNVTIRVSRDAGSRFDIYRMANLSFSLTGGGKRYKSSKISFRGPVAYANVTLPPGDYRLKLEEFGLDLEVSIFPVHPKSVTVGLRIKSTGEVTFNVR